MRIDASQLSVQRYPPFTVKYTPLGELVRVADNIPIGIPAYIKALPSIAGLGAGAECAPYDIVSQLNSIYSSFAANISYALEQGTAADPGTFASQLQQQAQQLCSAQAWGCPAPRCAVPTDLVNSLIQQYTQLYQSTMAQKVASIAAGDICVPSLALFPGIQLSPRAITACGYGGGSNVAPPPPAPSTSSSAPAPIASSSGSGSATVSVQVANASRPGQSFKVGDSFTVTINGPANQTVAVHGTQNGQDKGTTPFGNTDGSGRFTVNGTMTPDTVGSWTEVWTVGNTAAPPVNFSVAAAAAAPAPSSSGSSSAPPSSGSSSAPPSSSALTAPNNSSSSTSTSSFDLSSIMTKLQAPSPIMGLPWLAVIAIGGVGLWWLSSRGKR